MNLVPIVVAEAAPHFDRMIAAGLQQYEAVLIDFGAAENEIDAELARIRHGCVIRRRDELARLRVWLERNGAPLH